MGIFYSSLVSVPELSPLSLLGRTDWKKVSVLELHFSGCFPSMYHYMTTRLSLMGHEFVLVEPGLL